MQSSGKICVLKTACHCVSGRKNAARSNAGEETVSIDGVDYNEIFFEGPEDNPAIIFAKILS